MLSAVMSRAAALRVLTLRGWLPSCSTLHHCLSTKSKQVGVYVCSSCGNESSKWSGTCWYCKAYNTLQEFKAGAARPPKSVSGKNWVAQDDTYAKLTPIADVTDASKSRLRFGSEELDRLFGGGLVKGSVTLFAGPPGVGKSTLSLQMACLLAGAKDSTGQPYSRTFSCDSSPPVTPAPPSSPPSSQPVVVYVCGEESSEQVKGRATRLGLGDTPGLWLLNSTDIEQVLYQVEQSSSLLPPGSSITALVLDSVQTMTASTGGTGGGELGPQGQLREVGRRVVEWAHRVSIPVLLIGHVTKAGDVAGPRVLEHMVDAVMMVEGEQEGGVHGLEGGQAGGTATHSHRIVRASKNRHGSTSEVGLFRMGDRGFEEAVPSALFLSHTEGEERDREGCVVTATIEGTRALCIEVQALATPCLGAYPRHRAMGVPSDRLHLAWAVLSKHTHMKLAYVDLLVNVVGGLRVTDPATDLALALSIASSRLKIPAPRGTVFLGELGLGGEVRPPARLQERLRAAAKLGFKHAYVGAAGAGGRGGSSPSLGPAPPLPVTRVRHIKEAVSLALGTIGTPHGSRRKGEGAGGRPFGDDHGGEEGDSRKRPSPPTVPVPPQARLLGSMRQEWADDEHEGEHAALTAQAPSPRPSLPPLGHPDWAYGGMDSSEDEVGPDDEHGQGEGEGGKVRTHQACTGDVKYDA